MLDDEWFACVHTLIPMKEAQSIPNAIKAVDAEWAKLADKRAWVIEKMQPRAQVEARANKSGVTVHFGNLMDLCHERHSELQKHIPVHDREYKGRVVFRGDCVKDETGFYAIFSEQGSSASRIEASKFLNAIARAPGNDGEDSDARGAYHQVVLDEMVDKKGTNPSVETWISLPRKYRPKSWDKVDDPVCPLRLNLYGHPLAGLYWEQYCTKNILNLGFEKVPGWECMFVHRQQKLFLSVYVDDFKMAGCAKNIGPMWDRIRKVMDIDPPVKMVDNVYLGCGQEVIQPSATAVQAKSDLYQECLHPKANISGKTAKSVPSESGASVHTVRGVIGGTTKSLGNNSSNPQPGDRGVSGSSKVRGWHYKMWGHAEQCVDKYLELSGKGIDSLKEVKTPCIDDHMLNPEDFQNKGVLSPVCSRIVLKVLYLARQARPDILWSVNALAREVTKWNVACDKRLHRLIAYVHHTCKWTQQCWVGDELKDCNLMMFTDASFAGDLRDSKSTTGMYMVIMGPHTFVPVSWFVKKQGATSHSSSEAEVIALDAAVRLEGVPSLALWELVVTVFHPELVERAKQKTKPVSSQPKNLELIHQILLGVDYVPPNVPPSYGIAHLYIMEDNEAVIKMTIKGRSPNMRHVVRTQRVDLDWLWERLRDDPGIHLRYVNTKKQLADMLTKGSFTQYTWQQLCDLCNLGPSVSSSTIPLTNIPKGGKRNKGRSIPMAKVCSHKGVVLHSSSCAHVMALSNSIVRPNNFAFIAVLDMLSLIHI